MGSILPSARFPHSPLPVKALFIQTLAENCITRSSASAVLACTFRDARPQVIRQIQDLSHQPRAFVFVSSRMTAADGGGRSEIDLLDQRGKVTTQLHSETMITRHRRPRVPSLPLAISRRAAAAATATAPRAAKPLAARASSALRRVVSA